LEKEESANRRRFFGRLAKLGVAGGISALLLGRLGEKTLIPPVHAADLVIDAYNTGTGTTELKSSPAGSKAFWVTNSNTATSSSAIVGVTDGGGSNPLTAVFGETNSTSGVGVHGKALATSGDTIGVLGESATGFGVKGHATATGDVYSRGVYGVAAGQRSNAIEGVATATTGPAYGVLGKSNSSSGVGVFAEGGHPGTKPIVAYGHSGHTANLQEWNVSGTVLTAVSKDGWMGIGNSSPARQLHIQGNQAVSRMDRDVDSAAFIFVRTAPGNFGTVWKSFMFGADAYGVNNGRFVIGDLGTAVSGISTKRLVIDNTGRVGIGTETPTELLHVAGNVRAAGFITGDMKFANNYIVTEDEREGLAFKNDAGEKIAILDREGNLRIKGKVIEGL